MKKILAALLLTLPTISVAIDLEGYYITAKGGISKTLDTGIMTYITVDDTNPLNNEDLAQAVRLDSVWVNTSPIALD